VRRTFTAALSYICSTSGQCRQSRHTGEVANVSAIRLRQALDCLAWLVGFVSKPLMECDTDWRSRIDEFISLSANRCMHGVARCVSHMLALRRSCSSVAWCCMSLLPVLGIRVGAHVPMMVLLIRRGVKKQSWDAIAYLTMQSLHMFWTTRTDVCAHAGCRPRSLPDKQFFCRCGYFTCLFTFGLQPLLHRKRSLQ